MDFRPCDHRKRNEDGDSCNSPAHPARDHFRYLKVRRAPSGYLKIPLLMSVHLLNSLRPRTLPISPTGSGLCGRSRDQPFVYRTLQIGGRGVHPD